LTRTGFGKTVAITVASIYTAAIVGGCSFNRDYALKVNGVPVSNLYAQAQQTGSDATQGKREAAWTESWWFPVLVVGIMAAGVGIAAAAGAFRGGKGVSDEAPGAATSAGGGGSGGAGRSGSGRS
jgi:hypothetical protein